MRKVNRAALICGLILQALAPLSAAVQVEQWDTHEITFAGPSGLANPFVDVTLSCTFKHADGAEITVNGFPDYERNLVKFIS